MTSSPLPSDTFPSLSNVTLRPARRLRGSVVAPPDKSFAHRAVFLNALAEGEAKVTNYLEGVDTWNSIHVLRQLGVSIEHRNYGEVVVRGIGRGLLQESDNILDVGTSASTMRFLIGFVAGHPITTVITSSVDRTRQRPMGRIVHPITQMGATIHGKARGELAPITVVGNILNGIDYHSNVASGEVKTGVLLAALRAQGQTSITFPLPCRDHTERMLRAMGSHVDTSDDGRTVTLHPSSAPLTPLPFHVPGEISAAVYWIVLGLVHPDSDITIRNVGVNPSRTGLIDILKAMGGDIEIQVHDDNAIETIADIRVRSSKLKGMTVTPEVLPRMVDEIPGFALAAALAEGETLIQGASDLRNKKINRLTHVAAEFTKLGALVEETPDGLHFQGVPSLKGTICSSHGDHRLGNSLAVAGLIAEGSTTIKDVSAITSTSYPWFWQDVITLCGGDVIQ